MKMTTAIAVGLLAIEPVTDPISGFIGEIKREMDTIRVARARQIAINARVPPAEIAKVFSTPLTSKARAAELLDLAHRFDRVRTTVGELKLKEI